MKPRLLLALFGLSLFSLVLVLGAGAQSKQPSSQAPSAAEKAELALREQQLARQFEEFQLLLLKLKQRMDRGTPEEQSRAKAIGRILDEVQKGSLKIEFDRLADLLRESKLNNSGEVKELADRAGKLTDELQRILRMFQDDPRARQLQEERRMLEKTIKEIEKLIKDEKQVQGQTEAGKTDKQELASNQNDVTKKTRDLNSAIDKFLGKAGEVKDLKGGPKDAGKNEQGSAKAKDDGEQPAQTADNQGKAKEGGDPKDPKDPKDPQVASNKGDAKGDEKNGESQAKPGDGNKEGTAKDPKGGDTKPGSQAKNNDGPKGSEANSKNNDGGKGSEATAKPGEKTAPSQAKQGDGGKAGVKNGKGSEPSPGSQAKQGNPSPSPNKANKGEAKSGNDSKGQSQAKSDGAKDGPPSSPSSGSPSPPQAKADHGAQSTETTVNDGPTPPPPPGSQKTKDSLAQNQKKILEAGYDMVKAEHKIIKGDNKPAVQNQQDAITKLEDAKKKLEELLRQTREEELERLLAALEARCRKMLEMQLAVLAGTEATDRAILSHPDKKALREDQQNALRLSDSEKEIITEATKAIQMLEEEGSGVAFPEVFQQVREDMKHVQRRLEIADVAQVTQAIETDIIASLKEMIEALKKAQQQNKGSGKPSEGGPPPDQKLLDKIAELKMIRSLQKRVNDRTQFLGRLFPNEQALDMNVRQQLQGLAERQERIFEIMDRFAKGDGK